MPPQNAMQKFDVWACRFADRFLAHRFEIDAPADMGKLDCDTYLIKGSFGRDTWTITPCYTYLEESDIDDSLIPGLRSVGKIKSRDNRTHLTTDEVADFMAQNYQVAAYDRQTPALTVKRIEAVVGEFRRVGQLNGWNGPSSQESDGEPHPARELFDIIALRGSLLAISQPL